jgi:hypothetical protein
MVLSLWMLFAVIALISLMVAIFSKGKLQSYAIWILVISIIFAIYFVFRPVAL